MKLNYTIHFYSYWQCNSSLDGAAAGDAMPLLDRDGLPYVPGRTLKGLAKEASGNLFGSEFTDRMFGVSDVRAGESYWSNAVLPETQRRYIISRNLQDGLKCSRDFVKLKNGVAVDQALRSGQYFIPMTLHGTVTCPGKEDAQKLQSCLKWIKCIGLQRSRGFGRCDIKTEIAEETGNNMFPGPIEGNALYFKCTFLSDVVMNDTSATSGNLDTLDYIPGSNFLGIAAAELYGSLNGAEFDVFHSGKVRFSDALPLSDDNHISYGCPATWFRAKYNPDNSDSPRFFSDSPNAEEQKKYQPKQIRGGFFTFDGSTSTLLHPFPKSFTKKANLTTGEKERYGYTALCAGSQWYFKVTFDDTIRRDLCEKIVSSLLGERHIGRSANAQYGQILIERMPLPKTVSGESCKEQLYYIYANSNLALFDEKTGEPVIEPSPVMLGFQGDAKFVEDKTIIRTCSYAPWNRKRGSRDADRLCIMRGSVFCVKASEPPANGQAAYTVGAYLSEGFGEVLVNPEFLHASIDLDNFKAEENMPQPRDPSDSLLAFLDGQAKKEQEIQRLYRDVAEFMKSNRFAAKHTASQWGAIRAIANSAECYSDMMDQLFLRIDRDKEEEYLYEDYIKCKKQCHDLHEKAPGFLYHGKKAWGSDAEKLETCIEEIRKANDERYAVRFVTLLCSQMAKNKQKGESI